MKNLLISKNTYWIFWKIWNLLENKRKFQLILVIFFMILSGLGEMITIAALYPYINLINNPPNVFKSSQVEFIISFLNIETPTQLIFLATFIFIFIVSITSIIRLLNLTLNFRIAALIGNELAVTAYNNILSKEFIYHKKINSSNLISALTTKITLTIRMIRSFLQLITSSIVLSFIIFLTFLINKNITIIIGSSVTIIYLLISTFTRKKLYKNSSSISLKNNAVVKSIQEGFGSIREILLYRFQKVYVNSFKKNDLKLRLSIANSDIIAFFPKYILEGASIIIICLLGLIVFTQSNQNEKTIPLLATFALAFQKILPAAQLIYSSFSEIRVNRESALDVLEIIKDKDDNFNPPEKYQIPILKEIEFSNVYFKYEKNQPYIINNLSIKIKSGEFIGLIGETGSGKTTFIDLLTGLIKPTKGKILVNGKDIFASEKSIKRWRESIAIVPQYIFLLDNSIKENILFGEDEIDPEKMKFSIKISQLDKFIKKLRNGLITNIGERGTKISGGQQQRIGLARAFYKNKPLMIFDEATSALDERTEEKILKELSQLKRNKTTLMITHRLSTLNKLDRILLLRNGNLIFDKKPNEIKIEQDVYNIKNI